jgi:Rrf2 family protein
MARATRFSVAVHALALIGYSGGQRLTSAAIAASVGTNASFVRRVLSMLGRARLVRSASGVAGAQLARPAARITLLDIYRAVKIAQEHRLAVHGEPSRRCPVGRHIQGALHVVLAPAERAFEAKLRRRTLADVIRLVSAEAR